MLQVFACQLFQVLHLFYIWRAHEGSQIEVESRDGLTAVHFVLCRLHGDASQHRSRLNALGGSAAAVAGVESVLQYVVQRMLHAGERFRGVVVLVVNVDVVVHHRVANLFREQVVVDERFCRLARELHHHARRRVGVHVCVLTRHVVVLDVDNLKEDVTRLRFAGYRALVAVGNVFLSHVFACTLHQLHLHRVLNVLHRHLWLSVHADAVCNLLNQRLVVALLRVKHSLADGCHDFLFVEAHDTPVALHNCLYHIDW